MRNGERKGYVYIMASKSRVLYIGVTSDLDLRVRQHQRDKYHGFSAKYRVHRLVYYEQHSSIVMAITRESQLKRWRREKKVALIERLNPTWEDLSAEWGKPLPPLARCEARNFDSPASSPIEEIAGSSTPLRSGRNDEKK
jgi:putative endonuclease